MPVSLTCPGCGARLKAPDGAAGRTLRCPRCARSIAVPAAAAANPFADAGPPFPSESPERPAKGRRPAAPKPAPGYNPFDPASEPEPTAGPPKKRRYGKDADYNPFGDTPADEVPDPAGDGFEFGAEAPPPAPTGEFDFGPLDPRGDDGGPRRRR